LINQSTKICFVIRTGTHCIRQNQTKHMVLLVAGRSGSEGIKFHQPETALLTLP